MVLPEPVTIPSLPPVFTWLVQPQSWQAGERSLELSAGPRCDLYSDPGGTISAGLELPPMLLAELPGDFALSARVQVEFAAAYDAGVLVLYRDEGSWAKLCFERSPQGQPMVVSVVNRGLSDDCNHFDVAGNRAWLRVVRGGDSFAFHASLDGRAWSFVRSFALDDPAGLSVGFEAQSPTGEGCRVSFDEIRLETGPQTDLRCGG